MRDQAADHARIALHRVEVAIRVAASDSKPGDQVVEHEVVQNHDAAIAT